MAERGNTFALGQANASNPFNIESELVRLMASGPAGERIGATWIGPYQTERRFSDEAYNQQVLAQNQFARQQAAQQAMQEDRKAAIDLFSKTGGAELLANSPSLQQSLATDIAGPAFANVASVLKAKQLADIYQSGMSGENSRVQAGGTVQPGALAQFMPGVTSYNTGVPLQKEITLIKEAGDNARAAAHAAAASGPTATITTGGGYDSEGRALPGVSVPINPKKATYDQSMALRQKLMTDLGIPTAGQDYHTSASGPVVPNAGGGGNQSTSSAPSNSARTSTTGGGSGPPPEVVDQARKELKRLEQSNNPADKQVYQNIVRNMDGSGRLPLYQLPNGQWNFRGATR